MAAPGDYILLLYNEPGQPLYHEALVTGVSAATPTTITMATPDGDHYPQSIEIGDDVLEVRWIGMQGATPPGVDARHVYRFRQVPSAPVLRQYYRDAALMLGNIAPPPALQQRQRPAPGAELAAAPGAVPAGAAAAAAPPGRLWVYAEDCEGHRRGDAVGTLPADAVTMGDHGIVQLQEGTAFIQMVERRNLEQYVMEDLRVLPVKFDGTGQRRRPFAESVQKMAGEEPEGGLDLTGPRMCFNRLQQLAVSSQTPITQSEHWRHAARIPDGDRSQYEHEALSHIMEAMCTVDQLNAPALKSAELVSRRLQLIEDAHASGGIADYSAADHYMGWSTRRSGAVSDPGLRSHVAEQVRGEAAVAKEMRKAKEEQRLRKQNPNKKKNDDNGNG